LPGTLYIIATPIGNLEDITYRAVRILKECDAVACEDTRQTRKLLDHYGIRKPLVAFHEHNERERADELCRRMAAGENLALTSDAGTPLISDPGFRLVSEAVSRNIPVVPVPGPSAVIAALSASGLATDKFQFRGFLPPKRAARLAELAAQAEADATLIYYEAPHRILDSLADLAETFPGRRVALARELTKVHEEILRGAPGEIRERLARRPSVPGEITILIEKAARRPADLSAEAVSRAVARHERSGLARMEAMKAAARELGVSKSAVYRCLAGS
jgi:16S rRNA (cytidine1402-2'-O)-methyltransferase